MYKLLFFIMCMLYLTSCQRNLTVNKFVKEFKNCPDSLITYASGKDWYGLKKTSFKKYQWGNNDEIEGMAVYKDKGIPLGKGSVVKLDNEDWIIYNIKYKDPPARVGNPVPLPQHYDVKVFLKKKCK